MDLKQAKIMSASVIGIFAVIVAVIALSNNGVDIKQVITNKISHKSIGFSKTKQSKSKKKEPVKWCYATYAPHGAIWSSHCYDSKKECKSDLKNDRAEGRTVNTKSCYKDVWIEGVCLDNVYTGTTRFDDFYGMEYRAISYVCTKSLEECETFHSYQSKYSKCYKARIRTRESEYFYLTPKSKKAKIIEAGKVDPNKCNTFPPAENQQQALENLGLDWNKTKNWGAFVDVNDILRADKPSCREIVKDSQEYNKYKRK